MNRKFFLSSVLPFTVILKGVAQHVTTKDEIPSTFKIEVIEEGLSAKNPPYLKKGDLIGITAPAGYITLEEIQPAIKVIESWGYKIKVGETIGKRDFTFGGSDIERTEDFQQMLDDPQLKAILCARGGYGIVRIIDALRWDKFKLKLKWIIGFSDATV